MVFIIMDSMFERYVNFEFYKTTGLKDKNGTEFERYVNFEFYKTALVSGSAVLLFERYVNFEFYKTVQFALRGLFGLRDM